MSFFNRKEEVIDIEITPYGKFLLSVGRFKPAFYDFSDDDILYDSAYAVGRNYAGQYEQQNEIEERIKETPRIKTLHQTFGVETNIKEVNRQIVKGMVDNIGTGNGVENIFDTIHKLGQKVQPISEKDHFFGSKLGTCDMQSNYAPAWSVQYLMGEISSSAPFLEVLTQKSPLAFGKNEGQRIIYPIPQINSIYELKYNPELADTPDAGEIAEPDEEFPDAVLSEMEEFGYPDEETKLMNLMHNGFVLDISELNTPFEKENFEISVFMSEPIFSGSIPAGNDAPTGQVKLTPLSFARQPKNILDLDNEQALIQQVDFEQLDSSFVEHYFHVLVDDEINNDLLCSIKPYHINKGVFANKDEQCLDESGNVNLNIYEDMDEDAGEVC